MIAIVDYNIGNLASVQNAFTSLGEATVVESNPDKFKDYDKLILPGVGAFGDAMEHLRERNMIEALRECNCFLNQVKSLETIKAWG